LGQWTARSSASWLTLSPSSGTGNAVVTYTFTANSLAAGRIATLAIAGRTFAVAQAGTAGRFIPWGPTAHGWIQSPAGNGQIPQYTSPIGDGTPATLVAISANGIGVDGNANFWFTDTYRQTVRRVDSTTGYIGTIAGTGTAGYSGDGGPASTAMIQAGPVTADQAGNIYLADSTDNVIREISAATGQISTIAGGGMAPDGYSATQAAISQPAGMFVDAGGNIYFADSGSNRIRRIDSATGVISTVAGNGVFGTSGDGGAATAASLDAPTGVAIDSIGNIYISSGSRIRKVNTSGNITTLGVVASYGTLAIDGSDHLFVTTAGGNSSSSPQIQQIDTASGQLTAIVGGGTYASIGDGDRLLAPI
jgi:sugar lactone lactonase YvrE